MLVREAWPIGLLLLLAGCSGKEGHQVAPAYAVQRGEVDAGFRGNEKYGVSGVAWWKHAPTGRHAFATTGLQFEHIVSGVATPHNFMTPRYGPFPLTALEDGARLERRAEHEAWGVPSNLTYRVVPPDAIDFEFRATVPRASAFGTPAFASFFFASYMNVVEDPELSFRGIPGPGASERWVTTSRTGKAGEHYAALDAPPLTAAPDDELAALNLGQEEWPRIARPFFIGRVAPGMAYAVAFDRLRGPEDEIRFTIMRWDARAPAWDFQYVARDLTDGKRVGFRGRAIFRRFTSLDEIARDLEAWREALPAWEP